MNNQVSLGSENAAGFPRLSIYPPRTSVPGSLDPPSKRGDGGVSPPPCWVWLEGGPIHETPSSHTIKGPLVASPLKCNLHVVLHAMVWPFTVESCLLCARALVRAVIRTPCCRVLVHKTCLYAALAITPSRPTPTCPHCRQVLGLAHFRRLCWRLSGKWSPWFECPLAPVSPSRSFLPWGLLTEHGAATTVFRWSSRRPRRTGKWNPSV